MNVGRWERFGSRPGFLITVDYRQRGPRGGTWPGGRATLQGNFPRGVRTRKRADDARYIYISYTLLAELHLFEQVKNLANDYQAKKSLYLSYKNEKKKGETLELASSCNSICSNRVYEYSIEKILNVGKSLYTRVISLNIPTYTAGPRSKCRLDLPCLWRNKDFIINVVEKSSTRSMHPTS